MKTTIATTLLALALPLAAQDVQEPKVPAAEAMFYKAYYLEKGDRKFEEAVVLYQEFLKQAPEHKLAAVAAKQNFRLLDRMGKTKERDAFKAKFEKLLGNVANASNRRPARPDRGEGNDSGRGRGQRGGGFGGQRGGRGGMRAVMTMMRGDTKLADMSEEDMTQVKEYLKNADESLDRMSRFFGEEVVEKLKKSAASMKTALDGGKMEEAQKALDEMRKAMPQRRGRGGNDGGNRRRRGEGEGGNTRRRRAEGAGTGGGKVEAGKKKEGGGGGGR